MWKIEKRKGRKDKASYHVVWVVAGERRKQAHQSYALADSFRSELLTAVRKGEAFDTETGLPVSQVRAKARHCSRPGQSGLARPSQAEASALPLSAEPEDTGILRWTTAIRPSRPSIRAANNRGSAGSPARWSAWSGSKPREPPPGMLC
jgi:hypothetical protein